MIFTDFNWSFLWELCDDIFTAVEPHIISRGRVGDVGDVELYFTVLTHSQLSRSIVVSEQPGPPLD